uniref:VAN3-binding protein-like auxin canalisation domain-containing protein n=1 Tax=Setaria italica TaxID=4555 RepID=K3ZDI6_SETIT
MTDAGGARRAGGGGGDLPLRPPEPPRDPLEFLSRSWSASAADVSRALAAAPAPALVPIAGAGAAIDEDVAGELDCDGSGACGGGGPASGSSFSFASAATSQLIMDRIMAQSQEVSPLTSGRLSHSSGPLNGGGSLSDSPPVSPEIDEAKVCFPSPPPVPLHVVTASTITGCHIN